MAVTQRATGTAATTDADAATIETMSAAVDSTEHSR